MKSLAVISSITILTIVIAIALIFFTSKVIAPPPALDDLNWSGIEINFNQTISDLTEQTFIFYIKQNYSQTGIKINLSDIINSTNFPITNLKGMQFFTRENVTYNETVGNTICNPYNETTPNGTITNTNCTTTYSTITKWKWDWVEAKDFLFKVKLTEQKAKSFAKTMTIPKLSDLDEYGNNGTKWFKLIIKTPITSTGSGWGSSGAFALAVTDIDETREFHPWWNANWKRKTQINISNVNQAEDHIYEYIGVVLNFTTNPVNATKEVRVIQCSPENSTSCTTQTRVKAWIWNETRVGGTTDSATIAWEANVSARSWRLYEIYYNFSSAEDLHPTDKYQIWGDNFNREILGVDYVDTDFSDGFSYTGTAVMINNDYLNISGNSTNNGKGFRWMLFNWSYPVSLTIRGRWETVVPGLNGDRMNPFVSVRNTISLSDIQDTVGVAFMDDAIFAGTVQIEGSGGFVNAKKTPFTSACSGRGMNYVSFFGKCSDSANSDLDDMVETKFDIVWDGLDTYTYRVDNVNNGTSTNADYSGLFNVSAGFITLRFVTWDQNSKAWGTFDNLCVVTDTHTCNAYDNPSSIAILSEEEVTNIPLTFSNNLTSNPTLYDGTTPSWFNATWSDDNCDNANNRCFNVSLLEINYTGAFVNYTMSADGNVSYFKIILPAGTFSWRIYANDSSNDFNATPQLTFAIGKGISGINFFAFNSTEGNLFVKNNSIVNFTAMLNTSSPHPNLNLSSNFTFNLVDTDNDNSIFRNYTKIQNTSDQIFNFTFYTEGNANWTSSSLTRYLLLDVTPPNVYSFEFNGSYININESVQIRINTTAPFFGSIYNISSVVVEFNNSQNVRVNVTASRDGSNNFTFNFTKSNFGELPANATIIYITNIYVNDSANNVIINSTNLPVVDYARTILQNITDYPDPATNGTGETFTVTAQLSQTNGIRLKGGNVKLEFLGNNYTMSYISANDFHQAIISSAVPANVYSYKVYFENSSYQSQISNGTIEIKSGLGGSSFTGGGGNVFPATIPEKEIKVNKTVFSVFPTNPSQFLIRGKTYRTIFIINNMNDKSLSIEASFVCPIIKLLNETIVDDACNWFAFDIGGELVSKAAFVINPNSKYSIAVLIKIPNNIEDRRREVTIIFNNTNEDFSRSVVYVLASPSEFAFGKAIVQFWSADLIKFQRKILGMESITGGTIIISTIIIGSISSLIWFIKKTVFV